MFPLTHLYTAKTVLGYENNQTVLGSLFPDYGSYLGIGRNICHEMGTDMYRYALEHAEDHLDFALGVLTHGTGLPGIDYYADEEYHGVKPGFCFQRGEVIAKEVAAACNLPDNMALWKTHNIIEMAFDAATEKRCPHLADAVIRALPVEGEDFCTDFLAAYLEAPEDKIREMFFVVSGYYSFDGSDIEDMATKFITSLERRHQIVGCDKERLKDLINKAVDLVDPIYDDFMAETTGEIKTALQRLTGKVYPAV